MGSVTFTDVRKSYGAVEVLRGINLAVAEGEFVALVGASGCGKSTLLRMVAGLEGITGGEIAIAGRRVNELSPKDRDIAMVFQSYALYPHMTVAENMAFSMRLTNAPMAERRAAVEKAARILDLEPLLERKPRELSGGQRQRVAMGRAIVRDPAVFLFDEPLSNLDAKLRVHMRTEIKALHRALRTTMLYVTHDQVEAMTMADRIVVMNGGVIEQAGTPFEVYDSPANTYVAGFIGSPAMNFLDGVLEEGAGGAGVRLGPDQWLPVASSGRAEPGRPVRCGLRPEHLTVAEDGLRGRVVTVEPTGSETSVVVDTGVGRLTCHLRERRALHPGEPLALRCAPAQVHLFDQQSGVHL